MRFLLLAASLALTACLGGAGGGSSAYCYSDGPLSSNVVLSPATAALGAGAGSVNVSVSYDYKTRSGAKIIITKYRVEDSSGKGLLNSFIEKNLKGSGSFTFNVPIDTRAAGIFAVRVQAIDECLESSRWAEATFEVVAAAALADKTGYAAVAANGAVYFVGGMDTNGQASNELLRYGPAAGFLVSLAPMPEARAHAAVVAGDGVIYVFGGAAYGIEYSSTFAYDIRSGLWTALAPLSQPMAGGTARTRDGLIYVDGELGLQAYDPVLDLWMPPSADINAKLAAR